MLVNRPVVNVLIVNMAALVVDISSSYGVALGICGHTDIRSVNVAEPSNQQGLSGVQQFCHEGLSFRDHAKTTLAWNKSDASTRHYLT